MSRHLPFRPLVVVPTKDNAATIEAVVLGCLEHCPDVLVVDDGCTDDTAALVAALAPSGGRRPDLLSHTQNQGKGVAIVSALQWAVDRGFSHILTIDADGQHLTEELPRFLAAARADPWAIIVGARDMAGAPGSSHFGRRFSNFWIWVETGHHIDDSQSGYRVYPVVPTRSLGLRPGRYEWEVEVLTRALWNGIAVRCIPCRVYYPSPEERVSSFRPFLDNTRISLLNTRLVAERILWPGHWVNRVPEPGGTWQGQHQSTTRGWSGLLWLVNRLGRRGGHWLLALPALFYLVVAGAQRRGLQAYLRRRFPDEGGLRRTWRALRIFHNFACTLVDRFHLLLHGPGAFEVIREGTEPLASLAADQGAILLSAHLGNADLIAGLASGGPLQSGQRRKVAVVQYASPEDPYLQLLERYRDRPQMPQMIALNPQDSMSSLEVLRALREGTLVALKGDRAAGGRSAAVPLLGAEALISTGPLLLAALSKAPLFFVGCFMEGRAYRLVVSGPHRLQFARRATREAELEAWAAEYARVLEAWTERYPEQWFNFHDPWLEALQATLAAAAGAEDPADDAAGS